MATDYRPRVERALRFIGEHLAEPLTVAEVARAAHLSEYHFHRIFTAIVGEPIGRYVTRRRLELAALRIAYEPERSIGEIALASGYSSPSNFTKAFTAHFGCPPTRVRSPEPYPSAIDALTRAHRAPFDPAKLHALPPDASEAERRAIHDALARRVRFEDCPGIDVACLASPEGYDLAVLERTWHELIDRATQLGIVRDDVDAFGLVYDSPEVTSPERCRYHACVPCPAHVPLAPPLFRGRIPAGRYAIFSYQGPTEGIAATYRDIYSVWLPRTSLAPDDFVAVDHYVNDWPVDGRVDLEVWIKVRAR